MRDAGIGGAGSSRDLLVANARELRMSNGNGASEVVRWLVEEVGGLLGLTMRVQH